MTILLVIVGHSEGARWAGRECRDGGWANDSGGDEKAVVMWNWIITQVTRVILRHMSLNYYNSFNSVPKIILLQLLKSS